MKSKVQKWGNSLAVRIPKVMADEMGIKQDSSIEMMVEEGVLQIAPDRGSQWMLDVLLASVTDENKHGEWDTGAAEGSEQW